MSTSASLCGRLNSMQAADAGRTPLLEKDAKLLYCKAKPSTKASEPRSSGSPLRQPFVWHKRCGTNFMTFLSMIIIGLVAGAVAALLMPRRDKSGMVLVGIGG